MIYNTVELDDMQPVESYTKEPTWIDTFKAATKNFTSVSLSSSELSYFTEERDKNMEEWKTKDPVNKSTYDRYGTMPKASLDKLEVLYENGNIDAIKNFNTAAPGTLSTGDVFLKFKELQGVHGFKGYTEFNQDAKDKSLKDFQESQAVLANSDSLSAEMLGTMYGALHDPITLGTLPLGGWTAGRGVMMNAARSFGQEAMIETGAQAIIAPTVLSYKKEIGLKTSVATEAYNAAMAIGTAGLVRGTGSAIFDLSEKGIKALKLKNPSLGAEYEAMAKTQPTQDMKTHIDNMQKVEFSGEPLSEIKTPNEKGVELNNAKPISEVDEGIMYHGTDAIFETFDITKVGKTDEGFAGKGFYFTNSKEIAEEYTTKGIIKEANLDMKKPLIVESYDEITDKLGLPRERDFTGKQSEEITTRLQKEGYDSVIVRDKDEQGRPVNEYVVFDESQIKQPKPATEDGTLIDEGTMQIVVDKDIDGNLKTRSYKEINQELDENDIMFKRIQDCILGRA